MWPWLLAKSPNYNRASRSGAGSVDLKLNFIHKMASSGEDNCEDTRVTRDFLDELPNFHIDIFSEREEHLGRFAEVSESVVEKFIEGEENANAKRKTFYDLKLVKKFRVEERHEKDSSN